MSTTSAETKIAMENELKVRSMKEICYIVAFCDKFKPFLKGIEFWPEVRSAKSLNSIDVFVFRSKIIIIIIHSLLVQELERAIATECENDLIENLHCTFLNNCLNRKKPIE